MRVILILLLICLHLLHIAAQCEVCGMYEGRSREKSQRLEIKADSSFVYEYTDNWASLIGGSTRGRWLIRENELVLMSEFNNRNYQVLYDSIDMCSVVPEYYAKNCDKLIRLQIFNQQGESIWALESVIINDDLSNVSTLGFDDLKSLDANSDISAYISADSVTSIHVVNGFYPLLEVPIELESKNYIRVSGDFSDQRWYAYIVEEKWRIRKNCLTGNKNFGVFHRDKKRGK